MIPSRSGQVACGSIGYGNWTGGESHGSRTHELERRHRTRACGAEASPDRASADARAREGRKARRTRTAHDGPDRPYAVRPELRIDSNERWARGVLSPERRS